MSINREHAKNCVGKGWLNLIDTIYDKLPPSACVSQVKEKFGGLRFYVDGIDDKIYAFIEEIENQSYKICEVCGRPGKQRNKYGWIKTLCDIHFFFLFHNAET